MTSVKQTQILLLLILLNYITIVCSSTCSKTSPCANGACCSEWGNCGYGPDFCGDKCLSNCNAKSECGKYGKSEKCPLNVCCSEFGFCGTTEDFCSKAKKCQNNCGDMKVPQCSSGGGTKLLEIGYYASWAAHRSCHPYKVKDIDPLSYTHLNYAFGSISGGLMIDPKTNEEISEMKQFTNLKEKNRSLKVLVSVGGWTFNDPGPTRHEFHNIVSTPNARKQFIESVRKYLTKYKFDGIDIDYEYPTAEDRGGSPEDTENYLKLVREMRTAFGTDYLITIAAPASYWYLRHFKIGEMSKYLDFINVMTYDIHGVWDRDIESLGPYVKSHTNMKEVELAFQLFLRDGVKSEKLAFGLGYYGRSFTLEKPSCTTVGCKFSGPGKPGRCTNSAGTLAWFEIQEIIAKNPKKTLRFDSASMSKILTWDDNQWVAYDDEETLAKRRQYAREHCLKGVMIWSIDQGLNNGPNRADEKATISPIKRKEIKKPIVAAVVPQSTSTTKPPLSPCDCNFFISNQCQQSNLPRKSQSDACSTDFCLSIRLNKYRTADKQRRMSNEDKRNTLIDELHKLTEASIKDLQKRDNCGLLHLFVDYDAVKRHIAAGATELVKRGFRQSIPNKAQLHLCTHVIGQWAYDSLRANMGSGTLVTGDARHQSKGARIDNQSGVISHENADYYNIQVQIGGDTFASVLIPAVLEIGQRQIRNALVQSLKTGHQSVFKLGDALKNQPGKRPGSPETNVLWRGILSFGVVISLVLVVL